jgi:hypothetical protein
MGTPMSGAYCVYCGLRCFVPRTMPADSRWHPGQSVHLATCQRGADHDRRATGYDYTTAINPSARCPDGGRCHHECTGPCWRVDHAGPLSGVYPGDRWPQSHEDVELTHEELTRALRDRPDERTRW